MDEEAWDTEELEDLEETDVWDEDDEVDETELDGVDLSAPSYVQNLSYLYAPGTEWDGSVASYAQYLTHVQNLLIAYTPLLPCLTHSFFIVLPPLILCHCDLALPS